MFHILAAFLLLSTFLAPANANLEGTKRIYSLGIFHNDLFILNLASYFFLVIVQNDLFILNLLLLVIMLYIYI